MTFASGANVACSVAAVVVVVLVMTASTGVLGQQTVWDTINRSPELGRFKAQINAVPILRDRLANPMFKFTVFAYTDDAYQLSQREQSTELSLPDTIKYHIYDSTGTNLVQLTEFGSRDVLRTMLDTPVYTSSVRVTDDYGRQVIRYYVNHAQVLERDYAQTYTTASGIVYLIDRVLVPVGKAQTIYGYLQLSENRVTKFNELIDRVVQTDPQFQTTLQTFTKGTAFVPNDQSFAKVPMQNLERIKTDVNQLKNIVRAHFNFKSVYFTGPMQPGEQYPMEFSTAEFTKDELNNLYFVTCNSVRTKLVTKNIPMMNGAIHIIEDVLFPYEDLPTKLRSQPDLQQFSGFINEDPQLLQALTYVGTDVATTKYTIMAPNDMAVSESMRINGPNRLNPADKRSMELLLKAHILRDELRMGDLKRELQSYQTTNPGVPPRFARRITLAGTELRFYRIGNESTFYVLSPAVSPFIPNMARIVTDDLAFGTVGATNGLLHYIDEFLGRPGRSVYVKIQMLPILNTTFYWMRQYGFDSLIRGQAPGNGYQAGSGGQNLSPSSPGQFNYTIFAPNDSSWAQLLMKNRAYELLQNGDAMSRVWRRHIARTQGSMYFLPDPSAMFIVSGAGSPGSGQQQGSASYTGTQSGGSAYSYGGSPYVSSGSNYGSAGAQQPYNNNNNNNGNTYNSGSAYNNNNYNNQQGGSSYNNNNSQQQPSSNNNNNNNNVVSDRSNSYGSSGYNNQYSSVSAVNVQSEFTVYTLNYRETLRVRRVGDNFEVVYGDQVYQVLYPNIGCADGIIHIIDRPMLIKDDPMSEVVLGASSSLASLALVTAATLLAVLLR